jgi:hypothetical protein
LNNVRSERGQSTILALRCFEWVIASWADLAESAALRLFKVEAGINGLRPACGGSPPFNPFLP